MRNRGAPIVDSQQNASMTGRLEFKVPPELEASVPPEARGLARDRVRLMVSYRSTDRIIHARFDDIPDFLDPGDVLVINTSGTMNAALQAIRDDGTLYELHLSTHLPADLWVVELRQLSSKGTKPFYAARAGETFELPAGGVVTLHLPYNGEERSRGNGIRLWVASLEVPIDVKDYLAEFGYPIRYQYVEREWPSRYYQTVYATEVGSAEMPSAGRAFTPELVTRLVAKSVQVAPLILHTGVASLEEHEPPYEEYYRVHVETAQLVNLARASGRRIVAVGTTAVRALETVTSAKGIVHAGEGWTNLVITPERRLHAVDGMLTGFHEPRASHLAMLEALAGHNHLQITYEAALGEGYLWHEFGDLHLILP